MASNPIASFIFLERYINNGSPSRMDQLHGTSLNTRPKSKTKQFYLAKAELRDSIDIIYWGNVPNVRKNDRVLLLHPDMKNHSFILNSSISVSDSTIAVSPVSGSRTLFILHENQCEINDIRNNIGFYKLSYDGLIGRITRQLGYEHALSGVELSALIKRQIEKKILPSSFYFFPEENALVAKLMGEGDRIYEWGMVHRSGIPYPYNKDIKYLIPAFSLFADNTSLDSNQKDIPLLIQLIENQKQDPKDYLLDKIINPLIDIYFSLLLTSALQIECHSQNMVVALDKHFNVLGFVLRDLESIDKDLTFARRMGLDCTFRSAPYKCIQCSDYNYLIKHSFMFDFKFSEYLLAPLVDLVANHYKLNIETINDSIKDYTYKYISQLPVDFFPSDNCWYNYPNQVFDRSQKRPYIANPNPRFRY